jgi:hypothetical protein
VIFNWFLLNYKRRIFSPDKTELNPLQGWKNNFDETESKKIEFILSNVNNAMNYEYKGRDKNERIRHLLVQLRPYQMCGVDWMIGREILEEVCIFSLRFILFCANVAFFLLLHWINFIFFVFVICFHFPPEKSIVLPLRR